MEIQNTSEGISLDQYAHRICARRSARWAWSSALSLIVVCSVYAVFNHRSTTQGEGHGENHVLDHLWTKSHNSLSEAQPRMHHPLQSFANFLLAFNAPLVPQVRPIGAAPKATSRHVMNQLVAPRIPHIAERSPLPSLQRLTPMTPTMLLRADNIKLQAPQQSFIARKSVVEMKADISSMLRKDPQWNMFAQNVKIVDPSGAGVEGLDSAKLLFQFLHDMCTKLSAKENVRVEYFNVGQGDAKGYFVAWWKLQFDVAQRQFLHRLQKGTSVNVEAATTFQLNREGQIDTMWMDEWLVNGKEFAFLPDVKLRSRSHASLKKIKDWAGSITALHGKYDKIKDLRPVEIAAMYEEARKAKPWRTSSHGSQQLYVVDFSSSSTTANVVSFGADGSATSERLKGFHAIPLHEASRDPHLSQKLVDDIVKAIPSGTIVACATAGVRNALEKGMVNQEQRKAFETMFASKLGSRARFTILTAEEEAKAEWNSVDYALQSMRQVGAPGVPKSADVTGMLALGGSSCQLALPRQPLGPEFLSFDHDSTFLWDWFDHYDTKNPDRAALRKWLPTFENKMRQTVADTGHTGLQGVYILTELWNALSFLGEGFGPAIKPYQEMDVTDVLAAIDNYLQQALSSEEPFQRQDARVVLVAACARAVFTQLFAKSARVYFMGGDDTDWSIGWARELMPVLPSRQSAKQAVKVQRSRAPVMIASLHGVGAEMEDISKQGKAEPLVNEALEYSQHILCEDRCSGDELQASIENIHKNEANSNVGWPLHPTYTEELQKRLSQYAGSLGQLAQRSEEAVKYVVDPEAQLKAELLEGAHKACEVITEDFSKTFSAGTRLMTEEQRKATAAIYVWCRRTDDLVDTPRPEASAAEMTADLDNWRARLHNLWDNGEVNDLLDLAFLDAKQKYPSMEITPYLEMIEGMVMDTPQLGQSRYQTFDELYIYCYRVAATVGLMTLPVLGTAPGFTEEQAKGPAKALGIALQLTNILRDVGEDTHRGRIYLPQEDLARFGVTDQQILDGRIDSNYIELIKFEIKRAREYYKEAEAGIYMLAPNARLAVQASSEMYSEILNKIEENAYDNLRKRAYTTKIEKFGSLLSSWWKVILMG